MGNLNSQIPIVVVHKGPRKNSKIKLEIFENTRVDDIISSAKRKPLIPKENEILDLGVEFGIVKKSGSWFSYGDTKLGQGRDAVKGLIQDNPELAEELEQKIKEALDSEE